MKKRLSHSAYALLWLGWVVASTASVVIAWYVSHATIDVLQQLIGTVNEDHWTMPVLVVVMTVGQAVLQWLLLRPFFPRAAQWIAATIAGWVVACASLILVMWAGNPLRDFLLRSDLYPVVILCGLGLGIVQSLVLRRHIAHAGWWIPASVIGWLAVPLAIGPTINNVIEMAVMGAVPAAITGAVLVWLLRQPPHETALLPNPAV